MAFGQTERILDPDFTYYDGIPVNRACIILCPHTAIIHSAPLTSLRDVDSAVEELRRVAKLGMKGVFIGSRPHQGRSFGHPVYDPFWTTPGARPAGESTSGSRKTTESWISTTLPVYPRSPSVRGRKIGLTRKSGSHRKSWEQKILLGIRYPACRGVYAPGGGSQEASEFSV